MGTNTNFNPGEKTNLKGLNSIYGLKICKVQYITQKCKTEIIKEKKEMCTFKKVYEDTTDKKQDGN